MNAGEIDTSSGVPLYRQIKDIIRAEVTAPNVDPSEPITEAQLLERFNVSRAPIRQALRELTDEGYVYRQQGRGTFPVTGRRVNRPTGTRVGGLLALLHDEGLNPSTSVSEVVRVSVPQPIAEALMAAPGEEFVHFLRLISTDEGPYISSEVYLRAPEDFSPSAELLEDAESVFAMLEDSYGIVVDRAEHSAWATAASIDQAERLAVSEGSPLLVLDSVFHVKGGAPAGFRRALHHGNSFQYRFTENR